MSDYEPAEVAARLLTSRADGDFSPAWLSGTIDLPQALDLQLAVLDQHLAEGATVGGWKVGLTSEAARTRLGADERPFGFVLANRVLETGQELAADQVNNLSIETEMCFTIGSDITNPEIQPAEILDHIDNVAAGFELNEARPGSAAPDFFSMVTDCLTNWGIVGGAGVAPLSADALLDTVISFERNGEEVFRGVSKDYCDDHTISLCRLVEQLARHGQTLRAGQKVITGAFCRLPAEPGQHWRAIYDGIGDVEITII